MRFEITIKFYLSVFFYTITKHKFKKKGDSVYNLIFFKLMSLEQKNFTKNNGINF